MSQPNATGVSQIPRDWDDVTPEWMTAALAHRHPDAEVDSVTLLMRDDGTNRRARFALHYAAGSGPATVFLKAEAPAHRQLHASNGNLFNEAELFASGLTIPVEHPLVHRAVIDRPGLDYVMVMEDLGQRDADPRDATRPLTVDQVANGLRGLAALHARFWNFSATTRPSLAWVETWQPTAGFRGTLEPRIPIGVERGADALPAEVTRHSTDELLTFWARYVSTLADPPVTLLHGDAHIGNTYVLPDGVVGFLDWQVVRRGNWSQDVGYFLVGALTETDRRAHDTELIDEYLAALDVPDQQRPTAHDARLRYRASAAYGLPIWLATLGSEGFQSLEVSLALARRYAAAFVELDASGALSDLGG